MFQVLKHKSQKIQDKFQFTIVQLLSHIVIVQNFIRDLKLFEILSYQVNYYIGHQLITQVSVQTKAYQDTNGIAVGSVYVAFAVLVQEVKVL